MSCIYKGQVIESELSKNAMGGSELMRRRLLDNVDESLLKDFAIHFSRPREMYDDVKNILYAHDLAEDPEMDILHNMGWRKFDHFVFVSAWQRDHYINRFQIPYDKCSVVYNAIEKNYSPQDKDTSTIKFIYHTTPHRGLELLVPIFDALCKEFDNIELDVYSSFKIYGWDQRDEPYKQLFDMIDAHPKMRNHGTVSNEQIIHELQESHVFLYPSIWKETSCLALIEAIKSQCICVHPNLGALPETASNATIMYDWHQDGQAHANYCYSIAKKLIQTINEDQNYFNAFTTSDRFNLARNNIATFRTLWNACLRNLKGD